MSHTFSLGRHVSALLALGVALAGCAHDGASRNSEPTPSYEPDWSLVSKLPTQTVFVHRVMAWSKVGKLGEKRGSQWWVHGQERPQEGNAPAYVEAALLEISPHRAAAGISLEGPRPRLFVGGEEQEMPAKVRAFLKSVDPMATSTTTFEGDACVLFTRGSQGSRGLCFGPSGRGWYKVVLPDVNLASFGTRSRPTGGTYCQEGTLQGFSVTRCGRNDPGGVGSNCGHMYPSVSTTVVYLWGRERAPDLEAFVSKISSARMSTVAGEP